MTDEPHDPTGEVAHEDAGGTEPPTIPAPQPDLPSVDIPKLEAPVLPPPPTFTPLPPTTAEQPSVLIATHEPKKARSTGLVVASLVAVVALVAAVVLGVLWSGASGDADDAKADAADVRAELDATKTSLADLQSQVDSMSKDLDDSKASLEAAQSGLDDAKAENDDLQAQLEELQNASPGTRTISDSLALALGQAFGSGADPALTDDEATCLGHEFYDRVGLEPLLELSLSNDPNNAQIAEAFRALEDAAGSCNIDLSRFPS